MTAGTWQNLLNADSLQLFIENKIIVNVDIQKPLGVIDETLTWDKQIDVVCLNVSRMITLLNMLSKYFINLV